MSGREIGKDKPAGATPARHAPGDIGQSLPIPAPWGGDIYTGPMAEEAARQHDEYLQAMTSMHRNCAEPTDWRARAAASKPPRPRPGRVHQKRAQRALDDYHPGLMTRLLGKVRREREALRDAVEDAVTQDEKLFDAAQTQYEQGLELHEEAVDLARGVLNREAYSFQQAISLADPLLAIGPLGQRATFTPITPTSWAVKLFLHADDVVPEQRVRLLASGRVAVQSLPRQDYFRMLRDHVCSAGLRAVRELLALLPLEELIVTVIEDTPEPVTASPQRRTLLRFRATRDSVAVLDFHNLDSVDAMQKLWHRADFDGAGRLAVLEPEFEETD